MRTAFAMLIGAGVLSFAIVDCAAPANAAVRHRHAQPRTQQTAATAGAADYVTRGNNPAKRYPSRQASENAVKTGTLMQNGNNPAKRYSARHTSEAAMREQTLMTNGNNPAKKAKGTTGAAQ